MSKTSKQLDAEIAGALGLSPYASYLRTGEADHLRERGYQKLATGSARGEAYEIHGDETGSYTVRRSKDLSELAVAYVADDGRKNYLTSVSINDPKYKRLGIGTALYNAIEQHRGRKLDPSPTHQTDEGQAFWAERTRHHATRKKPSASAAKTTTFLGPCDRVRRQSAANEAKWHVMMARAQPVSFKVFTAHVDMTPMLEEDETPAGWWADNRRSDPDTGAYQSEWGAQRCWFLQTAGFEFIFLDRAGR